MLSAILFLTALVFAAIVLLRVSMSDSEEKEALRLLRNIDRHTAALVLIGSDIRAILIQVLRPVLTTARIHTMPKTVNVGDKAKALINGLDQNGQPLALDSTYSVSYSASNPSTVSFGTPNPDGSVDIMALAVDPGNTIGAVITRPDGGTVTASPDVLTILAPPPVLTSASVSLQ